MTKDSIASHLHGVLSEFTNAYVILGTSAADGSPIARFWCADDATREKLNAMVERLCSQGGLPSPAAEVMITPMTDSQWARN